MLFDKHDANGDGIIDPAGLGRAVADSFGFELEPAELKVIVMSTAR